MASTNLPSRPLKSTATVYSGLARGVAPPQAPVLPPLAPGWTEHKAPTGHTYFYNPTTKKSTYTRPVAVAPIPTPTPATFSQAQQQQFPFAAAAGAFPGYGAPRQQQFPAFNAGFPQHHMGYGGSRGGRPGGRGGFGQNRPQGPYQKRHEKPDRPKKKRAIIGAEPWVFVTTKLGRTFVHNLETKESLWKASEDVQKAIDKMKEMPEDELKALELKEKEKASKSATVVPSQPPANEDEEEYEEEEEEDKQMQDTEVTGEPRGRKRSASAALGSQGGNDEEGEEEEEEEEEEYEEDEGGDGQPGKRLKSVSAAPVGPVEFNEEDIEWQLAAMAEDYGLGEEDLEADDLPAEDATFIFKEMLTEKQINPYSTWESEYPKLVEDDRYTVLSTTKHRREVFTTWCRDHIAELKLEKAKERKIDPRVSFWNFLTAHATPKLYWAEFKRKFRKEPEMKDLKVTDKEREKMYRDYLAHIKISPAIRENDLKKLLKSTISLTHSTPLDDLPIPILIDVRYVTAPQPLREEIIREYIESLPNNMTPAERKEKEERQRKEAALRDRESAVRREQARLRGEIGRGRELLREEEAAIERAKVVGKKGLMSQIMVKKEDGEDAAKPVRAAEDGP